MTPLPTKPSDPFSANADWARDPDRPRVLISRMSAIGDTILTTPVACRLRDTFPNAHLAWVVEEKSSRFIEGHHAIDETVVLPRGWFVSPGKILGLRNQLLPMRFDAAIDCQSITKSALACWLSGAPLRVGCRGKYGSELSPLFNNRRIKPRRPHLTDRSLELLKPLGIAAAAEPYESVRWDLPRSPGAEQSVADWTPDEAFAVINPGATWDSKLWEMERFGEVAERIGRQRGLRSIVVWGGEREGRWADQIVTASNGWATKAPATSLQELAAVIGQARLMVSSDTGPMHLAVAVDTPTVGLFGSTHPDACGPYGAPHEAVLKRFHPGGRKARRYADNSAMRQISVDDAWQACRRVIDRTADSYPHAPAAMAS